MMRARARLAGSIFPMRPPADDLSRPCRSRNRPAALLRCLGVAGGSHILANPQAARVENQGEPKLRKCGI